MIATLLLHGEAQMAQVAANAVLLICGLVGLVVAAGRARVSLRESVVFLVVAGAVTQVLVALRIGMLDRAARMSPLIGRRSWSEEMLAGDAGRTLFPAGILIWLGMWVAMIWIRHLGRPEEPGDE